MLRSSLGTRRGVERKDGRGPEPGPVSLGPRLERGTLATGPPLEGRRSETAPGAGLLSCWTLVQRFQACHTIIFGMYCTL